LEIRGGRACKRTG